MLFRSVHASRMTRPCHGISDIGFGDPQLLQAGPDSGGTTGVERREHDATVVARHVVVVSLSRLLHHRLVGYHSRLQRLALCHSHIVFLPCDVFLFRERPQALFLGTRGKRLSGSTVQTRIKQQALAAVPGIPVDADGPVFKEPWEAQAFAMALALHAKGVFAWSEWATMLAEEIARELSLPLIDADDYHSRAAVERMKSGTPLADDYRQNWAERIIGGMIAWRRRGESVVIACSCIRRRTRDRFRTYVNEARIVGGQVIIAWLDVPPEVLQERLQSRDSQGTHFFPASLLGSQLSSIEQPDPTTEPGVVRVGVVQTDAPDVVARRVWDSVPMLHPFVNRA